MEKLSYAQILNLIKEKGVSLNIVGDYGCIRFFSGREIVFNPDETPSMKVNLKGYEIIHENNGIEIYHEVLNTENEFKNYLKKYNIDLNGLIEIDKINDRFSTLKEYEENVFFENISMLDLLEKYNDCNIFSLTSGFAIDSISNEQKVKVLNDLKEENKKYLLDRYNAVKDEYNLPPFELLYNDIQEEVYNFEKLHRHEYDFIFANSFICDHVGKDTKYSQPTNFFWHFYHNLGRELDSVIELNSKISNEDDDSILEDEEYVELKPYLIKTEKTYITHCTSGPLQKVYYFKLNNQTKNWLLKYENDYQLNVNKLCDLAIYDNDKLRFSSCTHEEFHNDIQ